MNNARSMNKFFTAAPVERIGNAYNSLIKKSIPLSNWTNGKIGKSASAFEPVGGITTPYIINQMLLSTSEFMPNQKNRLIVSLGTLIVYEEPFELLDEDDITIVTVSEELNKIIASDPFLQTWNGSRQVERLHSFELRGYGGKPKDTEVELYLAFRTQYIVDVNVITRERIT
jgi:hypothetical protein